MFLGMNEVVVFELFALTGYLLFIFLSFSDGFKLHVLRKLIWAVFFIIMAMFTFLSEGHFALNIIIFFSSFLAIILARIQQRQNQKSHPADSEGDKK